MLVENTLFGEVNKVEIAIQRLREFEPPEGYYLAFSGGKDSQTIYHLAKMAGVKFDAHYHLTTVDPPELIYFVRENYPNVSFDKPKMTMWQLIVHKRMPPTRMIRYCCDVLKEGGGRNRVIVTGVRWAESVKRSKRRVVEQCLRGGNRTFVNPIIDWYDADVWQFLNDVAQVPHCCLYDEGFTRLGCIACPLSGPAKMKRELQRWPTYRKAYLTAFTKMLDAKRAREDWQTIKWSTPEDVMNWWIHGSKPNNKDDQTIMLE